MRTISEHRRPVVVGVDGSPASTQAVRWAVREAVARQLPLTLVHMYEDPARQFPDPVVADAVRAAQETQARRWLRTATSTVHETAPDLNPAEQLRMGPVVATLVTLSDDAALVVLGATGIGAFTGMLVGSTANVVVSWARCPVAVVRTPSLRGRSPDGPVVVGIDGSEASEAAISFAFDEASQRGCALVAVHSWNEVFIDPELNVARIAIDTTGMQERAHQLLAQLLAGWQEKFPDVEVRRVVTQGRPLDALLEPGEDACLIVVGSRGHGGFDGMLLGSTSQALVHHAPCPLVVVRTAGLS
jgi:nucleotide-binding universal stress UspA family protein